jgi:exodeoxyribonuclease-1
LGNKIAEVFALSSFDRLPDAEQQLYEGFLPAGDRSKLEAVRSASAEGWKSSRFQFQDDRYNALLLRFKGRFHNESLSAEERVEWDRLCQKRWHEGVPGYLTLTQFLTTTDTILNQECSVTNRQKLLATKSWICNQLGIPET